MARTFGYCRVSTLGQTVENQIREIEAAGFHVEKRRLVTETVSGGSAIEQRPGFLKLLDRLERDDVLVVTKLDRLGRNSIDVQTTVKRLDEMAVRVHCLALGGVDLTSSAGKMTMGVIAAVAQFERDLLIERTLAGQARARAEGKRFGRKPVLDGERRQKALQRVADGASISAVAREMRVSRATIMRVSGLDRFRPPLMRSLVCTGRADNGWPVARGPKKRGRGDMTRGEKMIIPVGASIELSNDGLSSLSSSAAPDVAPQAFQPCRSCRAHVARTRRARLRTVEIIGIARDTLRQEPGRRAVDKQWVTA